MKKVCNGKRWQSDSRWRLILQSHYFPTEEYSNTVLLIRCKIILEV